MIIAEISLHFGVGSQAVLGIRPVVLRVASFKHIDFWVIKSGVECVIDLPVNTPQNRVKAWSSSFWKLAMEYQQGLGLHQVLDESLVTEEKL